MTNHADTHDTTPGDKLRAMVDMAVDRQWDSKAEPRMAAIEQSAANMRQREQSLTLTVGELQRGQREHSSAIRDLEDAVYGNEKHGQSGIVTEIRALRVSVDELKRYLAMGSGGLIVAGIIWQLIAPTVQRLLVAP